MNIIKIVQEETSKKILGVVLLIPAIPLSLLLKPIRVFLIETIPSLITSKTLYLLLYLTFWLLLVLIALILVLYKKVKNNPNFTGFKHDPDKQCWIHETTGQRICEACKTGGKLTPLSKFSGGGWKCPIHPDIVDYPVNISNPYDNGNLIPTITDGP